MGKGAVFYGTVAGVFGTTESCLERMRGKCDWTNSLIAGAATGAVIFLKRGRATRA